MLGQPSGFSQGNIQVYDGRQLYFGAYVNDNVRLSKRLNVQLGLRWEPCLPEGEKYNRMQWFEPAAFVAGTHTSQFVNAPPGLFFPGDPGVPSASAFPRYAIFEPRVGLAWDPTGSGRQTIRVGFGIFYDTMETAYQQSRLATLHGPATSVCLALLEGCRIPSRDTPEATHTRSLPLLARTRPSPPRVHIITILCMLTLLPFINGILLMSAS